MALKTLMLRKKLSDVQKQLEERRARAEAFATREAELEKAISEAQTDEEQQAVEAAVAEFENEKSENESEIASLSERVSALEKELAETEEKQDAPAETEARGKEFPVMYTIRSRRAEKMFGKMTAEQRAAMFGREDVKQFNSLIRTCISEKRALTNVGVLVPEVYLGLIRENITGYSKLYRHVNVVEVRGEGRTTIMGTIPEAVWIEVCGWLNELDLDFYNTEVDGYKVGGFIPVCNAMLEDSDIDLAAEIISAIGQAIGLALDKAILYGIGVKMPEGVLTRLAETSAPSNPSAAARPWTDLHTSNIKTISASLTGIDFYKALVLASGAAKGKYSRGSKVWVMNDTTYTNLKAEMLSISASGAVVSGIEGTLPIIGGTVETLEFMPDNVIIGGYFDLYCLAERGGTRISQSEHYRFLADQTVFKGSARYDGRPVIAEGFVAIGLSGTTPSASDVTFKPDTANPNADLGKLAGLDISGVTLNADFAPDTTAYTGTTTKASGTITATPQDGFDTVYITHNGVYVPNGGSVAWATGQSATNEVVVSVKDSDTGTVTSYTVTVTKS